MEKIFTERAHLMCPHMTFGIVMSTDTSYDEVRIKKSFAVLADKHPFLRAVIGHDADDNSFFYDITDSSKIDLILSDESVTGPDDPALIDEYHGLTDRDIDVTKEGLLKAVVRRSENGTVFLLVFHHLLADGRGALNLALELADLYAEDKIPGEVSEKLISCADDLPKGSEMPFFSRLLVKKANKDWVEEGSAALTYERYHEYADDFVANDKVSISTRKTEAEEVASMAKACREHGVTINDLLMANMYLEDDTGKIIIAKDIREKLPFYREGALGNYATAFSVVVKNRNKDRWALASEVHRKVQKALADPRTLYLILQCYANLKPEVLDAAFMAAKGAFASKSAEFIGKMFFGYDAPKGYSITNLGRIENENLSGAFFIPPASPAIRKTVGVLTVNGEMRTCTCDRG
ncbi:MAG: hypothetical protein K6F54_10425 [Lachnospiraceae bacterium]|nr:hypothetical protein [Lachnospiraceae bacterium]